MTEAIFWDVGGTLLDLRCSQTQSVRERLTTASIDHRSLTDETINASFEAFDRNERAWRTLDDERQTCGTCWTNS